MCAWSLADVLVVAACDAWMQRESAIAAARRFVQQAEASAEPDTLLRRERDRLEEVGLLMAGLQPGPVQAVVVTRAHRRPCRPTAERLAAFEQAALRRCHDCGLLRRAELACGCSTAPPHVRDQA